MKLAFGLKVHSGWAALVVIGAADGEFTVAERIRIELFDEAWAKQPYHAAEKLDPDDARETVARGIAAAERIAAREIRSAVQREQERGNHVSACAVLIANPMPDWSVAEILSVHIRMHKAEGVLFRDVLLRTAKTCGLEPIAIPEKLLLDQAEKALRISASRLEKKLAALGKLAGPPWGKDQKEAALAAMVALTAVAKTASRAAR
jgi:hypothetical protein